MIRLGSPPADTREMNLDDIFFLRLKLMIIMVKTVLDGGPLGDCRRKAMHENASHVEKEAMALGRHTDKFREEDALTGRSDFDFVFYQRVKLMALMVKAVTKGFPMGSDRRSAMQENLEVICRTLKFNSRSENMAFLKLA